MCNGRQLCISTNWTYSHFLWSSFVRYLCSNLGHNICHRNQGFFFFLATCAFQPPLGLWLPTLQCEWIYIFLRTPSIRFLLDCNVLRFSLHLAESVVREIQKTKRSVIVLFNYIFFLYVARIRFSLVYLCVQFVFSEAALHFLVRRISTLIAIRSKGVYITSLYLFSEINPEPWPVCFRPLARPFFL